MAGDAVFLYFCKDTTVGPISKALHTSFYIAGKLKFRERVATAAVSVSFVVMIVAVAVSSGFRQEIRKGISALAGDIRLESAVADFINADSPMKWSASFLDSLRAVEGVKEAVPVLYRAGIVKADTQIQGVLVKASDDRLDSLAVTIPARLASLLKIGAGDRLLTYFVGEKVKVRKFRVEAVEEGLLTNDEQLVIHAGKADLRRVNGWEEDECSSVELRVEDGWNNRKDLEEMVLKISGLLAESGGDRADLTARSSYQNFPQIFAWLDLIDNNLLLILLLMTVEAGFNMVSGLLILLFRNISTIGILKTVGMDNRSVALVFLKAASDIALRGMLYGNAVALPLCGLQWKFHLLHLDPTNYFLSYVPVHIHLPQLLGAELLSYLLIMVLLLLPCLFVSRVDPARSVRAQ